ncbi:tetratricopeptide repeat protein [Maribacter litopenaei]|uniref:Tetratricopeptide repeat protein n=1 Tax=Maribacter litopenaei TaxID=2976127 RepID=A0ABY5Y8U2_9FLAO|nr:adenylate/guanylate cyclase domain-containing protein [Maribacter litopenaei]UWX55438.1 tetratricopeptide repeat protein [Maribacter litopenaei]
MNLRGYSYFRVGEYLKALDDYNNGLKIALRIQYEKGIADILIRTGYVYHDNDDYVKAINYYERSLKIYEETNDWEGKSDVYNEFGSIYRANGDYEKSLRYYQQSLSINDSLKNKSANAPIYNNIGSLYLNENEFDKAIEYYDKALVLEKQTGNRLGIASALGGIGEALLLKEKYKKALDTLKKSLHISEEINDIQGGIATRFAIADIYLKQKEYSKAIEANKKCLLEAVQIGDLGNQEYAYANLYELYRTLGNPSLALNYHEKMLTISDSLQLGQTAVKLEQMEFKKQMLADSLLQVEKDLEVQMLHQQEVRKKDRNRNFAIVIGLFFLLLAVAFYTRWRYVKKSRAIIEKERNRSENLLLNILPAEIAEELKEKGEAKARDFEMVSILFTDFKGFTEQSAKISASELVGEINYCFKNFDLICEKYGIEKIKTIGDAYMAAGGLPVPSDDAVEKTIMAALEMQSFMSSRIKEKKASNEMTFEMRVGIHTGSVVAGIVGVKKFQYDIWGDTVNTASRMESNGEVGKVNISEDTYKLIKYKPNLSFEYRGKIEAKGKGQINMWFVGST